MNRRYALVCLLGMLGMVTVLMSGAKTALANPSQSTTEKMSSQNRSAQNSGQTQDDGQRVFEQNCSRCHTAPDGFSPRISKTVVRHMRMRANLSAEDERALLHFFNP